jgi:hypothetical protein
MTPDILKQDEPSLTTIMVKYQVLKERLNNIRSRDNYLIHRYPGGTALWHRYYLN